MSDVRPGMRCACGYLREQHDPFTAKCPLCACGEPPEQVVEGGRIVAVGHALVGADRGCPCGCGAPPSAHLPPETACGCLPMPNGETVHVCRWALWEGAPCPGRRGASGKWLLLRQGTFREPAEPAPLRDWFGLLMPMTDAELAKAVADVVPDAELVDESPRVPARPPVRAEEIAGAGGGKQASKLGRLARERGWEVAASYWQAADGTEGCAVQMRRDHLRAVATYSRPAELAGTRAGWKAGVAYGWSTAGATFPRKITHTELEAVLKTV